MSVAPDKIRDVMVTLDEGIQAGLPLDSLLSKALPKVAACIDARWVRAYRVDGQTAKLEAATASASPAEKQITDADREALENDTPVYSEGHWVAPILREVWVFGLLEVDAPNTPDIASVLMVLAYTLARAIEQLEASNFTADNLVLSSRLITTADNFSDMAQAAVYTIARNMTAAAITLFDQPLDANEHPRSRAVVALGSAEGPLDLKDPIYTDNLPDDEQLNNLWRGLPVIVQDFANSGFALSTQHLSDVETKWLAAFGLRAGDRVLGTLEILNADSYQLLPEEIDAYTTLADQMGVAVRNRQLLRQTSDALDEVKTLYEVNKAMIAAQDRLDVLRALYSLSPEAMSVAHITVEYDANGDISDLVASHMLTLNKEQVHHQSLTEIIGGDVITFARSFWQGAVRPVFFVDDVNNPPQSTPQEMMHIAKDEGIGSAVVVPVYENNRLSDVIRVGFDQPREFDSGTRRLYEVLADQIAVVFQNQRLLQETQVSTVELGSQVRVLQTLNNLASSVAAIRDETTLMEEFTRAMVTALNLDASHILLLTPSQQTLVVTGEYPIDGRIGREFDIQAVPFFQQVLESNSREPLVVNDVETDPRIMEEHRQIYRSIGAHSMISVPLFLQSELIGAVGLEIRRRQPGWRFSEQAIDTARTITTQLAVALQNIRLLNSAQRQAEQLQRASSFSQQLQSMLDLRAGLETALTQGREIVPFDYMNISLAEADSGVLRTAATYHHGESAITPTAGTPVSLDDTIFGQVWQSQEFIHIAKAEVNNRVGLPAELQSLMATPVFSRGRVLGLVVIGSDQPYAYTDVDEVVFGTIVSQIAIAIDNTTVYDQSRRTAMNEALVNDISARLQQQIDIPGLMSVAANELGRALGARRARVRLGTGTLKTNGDGE